MDLGDALRNRIQESVSKMLRSVHEEYSGHLTVTHEGTGFQTTCVINLPGQNTFQSSHTNYDPYDSAEGALHMLHEQIEKHNQRIIDKRRHPGENRAEKFKS